MSHLQLFLIFLATSLPLRTAVPAPLDLQPSRSRYQQADRLREITRNKVFRHRLQANWFAEGTRFWYRVDVGPEQHRFILVDATSGQRRDAFDHQRLADALSQASGKKAQADSLSIRQLAFDEAATTVSFSYAGTQWDCQLDSYELSRSADPANGDDTTVNILPAVRTATRNGPETSILFVNQTSEPVTLWWVNHVDRPTSYTTLPPGKQHAQHTFSGHVWLTTDEQGTPLGVYEAVDTEAVAVIDGSWRPGQRRRARDAGPKNGQQDRPGSSHSRGRSPNGKWTARIEAHNVMIRHHETDQEFQLSRDGTESDPYRPGFYWSPDSRRLVVFQERPGEHRQVHLIESSPKDQLQPKLHSFTYAKPGDTIDRRRPRLFDVQEQTQIEILDHLFANPWSISKLQWHPDSSHFTFLYNQRGHQVLRVISVDASTGATTALIDESSETFFCYSSKLYLRRLHESHEMIWMSERDGWNHLYLYDAVQGKVKHQITQGPWTVRSVERVDIDSRQIWFTAGDIHRDQDPYHVHHCRIDFDGSELVTLTDGDGTHHIEYSPDRQYFIDRFSRVDMPPIHELRSASDGALICQLEQADWTALLDTGWQPPERFAAKGRDGETDIYGVIYRPTDFDPQRQYPVIEQIYAGPHSAHVPKRFSSHHGAQSMAELGFILVQIDGMGTSHRSKKFHDVCYQDLADAGFPDRILWMKAAAATRPWMDISRVGIYGGSAGGQNAMRALIDHSDFYQVAAADCGCHDNRMDKIWWNEQWMGWPVGPHYAESSNVEQAHRLQGHLMLLVGELDRNVDPASTMQVVAALIKADKDFELILIPGAGHGAGGSRYGKRRQRDFFIQHLQKPATSRGS